MSTHPGTPTWIDLATSDIARSQQFYGAVFGWVFSSPGENFGGYLNATKDGKLVAGLMPNDPQWNAPDGWSTYLHTPDIDTTLAAVTAAGGTSCGGVTDVGDSAALVGRMAIANDPAGALFGLWQPGAHAGFELTAAAGSPAWFQLTVTDYAAALTFYTSVFGLDTKVEADTAEFRYTNAIVDGEPVFGVMDGSGFAEASEWSVFLAADDVDASLEVVKANGGTVLRGAEDTPYGRLAAVADPTGARFNLSSPQ
jgi:predicted enzyme related to lactoylglutathione lyase